MKCKALERGETYYESTLKLRLEDHINFKDTSKSVNIMITQLKVKTV